MPSNPGQRALTFLVWIGVGLSAAYWGLGAGDAPPAAPAADRAPVPRPSGVDAAALVSVLAGTAVAQEATAPGAGRWQLLGVIAEGRRGVALLSVDGAPGRPVLVGTPVAERVVLKSVGPRQAELADAATGAVVQRLELPPKAPAELPAGLTFTQAGRP